MAVETGKVERVIQFEGCYNFRDLGGYRAKDGKRVRWRRIFRSANHSEMTSNDIVRATKELGITSVIDLRRPQEMEQAGRTPLADVEGVRYLHFNFVGTTADEYSPDPDDRMVDIYLRALEPASPTIVQAINLLAQESSYPIVFHCAGGKDRTGILAAIILDLLGVSDDDIADDYALTQVHQRPISQEELDNLEREVIRAGYPKDLLYSQRETMIEFLVEARARFGSFADYIESGGVSTGNLLRLEEFLLEQDPSPG